jgi:hypothetical protein
MRRPFVSAEIEVTYDVLLTPGKVGVPYKYTEVGKLATVSVEGGFNGGVKGVVVSPIPGGRLVAKKTTFPVALNGPFTSKGPDTNGLSSNSVAFEALGVILMRSVFT